MKKWDIQVHKANTLPYYVNAKRPSSRHVIMTLTHTVAVHWRKNSQTLSLNGCAGLPLSVKTAAAADCT